MDPFEGCPPMIPTIFNRQQEPIEIYRELAIVAIVANILMSLAASLGNGMIIIAILRSPNLQTPSYLLITSLAFTDLLVGLVFHPLYGINCIFLMHNNIKLVCITVNAFSYVLAVLCSVSFSMVACMSIDRYMALSLKHRYNIIVTKKRVRLVIVAFWILAISNSSTRDIFIQQFRLMYSLLSLLAIIFLFITCIFYIKSFRALHLYTVQVHPQQASQIASNFDVVRYRKTLKTMVVILACICLCLVPVICAMTAIAMLGHRVDTNVFLQVGLFFIALSSSINQLIYMVRFTDVRNACKQMLGY